MENVSRKQKAGKATHPIEHNRTTNLNEREPVSPHPLTLNYRFVLLHLVCGHVRLLREWDKLHGEFTLA